MVIGQEKAQKELNTIFEIFIASEGKIRPHFILTGDSGCGKSHIIKSFAKKVKI